MSATTSHAAAVRALAWHGPPHAAMLGVMVAVMAPGADAVRHLAGAVLLVAIALLVAPFSRRRRHLIPVLTDLGAMATALAVIATAAPVAAHHHGGGPAGPLLLGMIGVGWAAARLSTTRGAVPVATGVVCGVQLVVMIGLAAG